jgi:hypothetical protein
MDISIFKELSKFDNISFYAEPHAYFIDDRQVISVTTLLGRFKPEFEHDKIIAKSVKKAMRENPMYEIQGRTEEDVEFEIAHDWIFENKHACYEGTLVHSYLENLIANKHVESDKAGLEYLEYRKGKPYYGFISFSQVEKTVELMKSLAYEFYKDYVFSKILIPIKSELIIGNAEMGIAGMLDQLFYNTITKTLQIWDWKSNKEVRSNSEWGHKMLYCLDHLDECQLNEYSVQLHSYKHIIEKSTNLILDDVCNIVWFNELNSTYKIIPCIDMRNEVINIFDFKEKNTELFEPTPFKRPELKKTTVISVDTHDYFSIS